MSTRIDDDQNVSQSESVSSRSASAENYSRYFSGLKLLVSSAARVDIQYPKVFTKARVFIEVLQIAALVMVPTAVTSFLFVSSSDRNSSIISAISSSPYAWNTIVSQISLPIFSTTLLPVLSFWSSTNSSQFSSSFHFDARLGGVSEDFNGLHLIHFHNHNFGFYDAIVKTQQNAIPYCIITIFFLLCCICVVVGGRVYDIMFRQSHRGAFETANDKSTLFEFRGSGDVRSLIAPRQCFMAWFWLEHEGRGDDSIQKESDGADEGERVNSVNDFITFHMTSKDDRRVDQKSYRRRDKSGGASNIFGVVMATFTSIEFKYYCFVLTCHLIHVLTSVGFQPVLHIFMVHLRCGLLQNSTSAVSRYCRMAYSDADNSLALNGIAFFCSIIGIVLLLALKTISNVVYLDNYPVLHRGWILARPHNGIEHGRMLATTVLVVLFHVLVDRPISLSSTVTSESSSLFLLFFGFTTLVLAFSYAIFLPHFASGVNRFFTSTFFFLSFLAFFQVAVILDSNPRSQLPISATSTKNTILAMNSVMTSPMDVQSNWFDFRFIRSDIDAMVTSISLRDIAASLLDQSYFADVESSNWDFLVVSLGFLVVCYLLGYRYLSVIRVCSLCTASLDLVRRGVPPITALTNPIFSRGGKISPSIAQFLWQYSTSTTDAHERRPCDDYFDEDIVERDDRISDVKMVAVAAQYPFGVFPSFLPDDNVCNEGEMHPMRHLEERLLWGRTREIFRGASRDSGANARHQKTPHLMSVDNSAAKAKTKTLPITAEEDPRKDTFLNEKFAIPFPTIGAILAPTDIEISTRFIHEFVDANLKFSHEGKTVLQNGDNPLKEEESYPKPPLIMLAFATRIFTKGLCKSSTSYLLTLPLVGSGVSLSHDRSFSFSSSILAVFMSALFSFLPLVGALFNALISTLAGDFAQPQESAWIRLQMVSLLSIYATGCPDVLDILQASASSLLTSVCQSKHIWSLGEQFHIAKRVIFLTQMQGSSQRPDAERASVLSMTKARGSKALVLAISAHREALQQMKLFWSRLQLLLSKQDINFTSRITDERMGDDNTHKEFIRQRQEQFFRQQRSGLFFFNIFSEKSNQQNMLNNFISNNFSGGYQGNNSTLPVLGSIARTISVRRSDGLTLYHRIMKDTLAGKRRNELISFTTVLRYANFLEQVVFDAGGATRCRQAVRENLLNILCNRTKVRARRRRVKASVFLKKRRRGKKSSRRLEKASPINSTRKPKSRQSGSSKNHKENPMSESGGSILPYIGKWVNIDTLQQVSNVAEDAQSRTETNSSKSIFENTIVNGKLSLIYVFFSILALAVVCGGYVFLSVSLEQRKSALERVRGASIARSQVEEMTLVANSFIDSKVHNNTRTTNIRSDVFISQLVLLRDTVADLIVGKYSPTVVSSDTTRNLIKDVFMRDRDAIESFSADIIEGGLLDILNAFLEELSRLKSAGEFDGLRSSVMMSWGNIAHVTNSTVHNFSDNAVYIISRTQFVFGVICLILATAAILLFFYLQTLFKTVSDSRKSILSLFMLIPLSTIIEIRRRTEGYLDNFDENVLTSLNNEADMNMPPPPKTNPQPNNTPHVPPVPEKNTIDKDVRSSDLNDETHFDEGGKLGAKILDHSRTADLGKIKLASRSSRLFLESALDSREGSSTSNAFISNFSSNLHASQALGNESGSVGQMTDSGVLVLEKTLIATVVGREEKERRHALQEKNDDKEKDFGGVLDSSFLLQTPKGAQPGKWWLECSRYSILIISAIFFSFVAAAASVATLLSIYVAVSVETNLFTAISDSVENLHRSQLQQIIAGETVVLSHHINTDLLVAGVVFNLSASNQSEKVFNDRIFDDIIRRFASALAFHDEQSDRYFQLYRSNAVNDGVRNLKDLLSSSTLSLFLSTSTRFDVEFLFTKSLTDTHNSVGDDEGTLIDYSTANVPTKSGTDFTEFASTLTDSSFSDFSFWEYLRTALDPQVTRVSMIYLWIVAVSTSVASRGSRLFPFESDLFGSFPSSPLNGLLSETTMFQSIWNTRVENSLHQSVITSRLNRGVVEAYLNVARAGRELSTSLTHVRNFRAAFSGSCNTSEDFFAASRTHLLSKIRSANVISLELISSTLKMLKLFEGKYGPYGDFRDGFGAGPTAVNPVFNASELPRSSNISEVFDWPIVGEHERKLQRWRDSRHKGVSPLDLINHSWVEFLIRGLERNVSNLIKVLETFDTEDDCAKFIIGMDAHLSWSLLVFFSVMQQLSTYSTDVSASLRAAIAPSEEHTWIGRIYHQDTEQLQSIIGKLGRGIISLGTGMFSTAIVEGAVFSTVSVFFFISSSILHHQVAKRFQPETRKQSSIFRVLRVLFLFLKIVSVSVVLMFLGISLYLADDASRSASTNYFSTVETPTPLSPLLRWSSVVFPIESHLMRVNSMSSSTLNRSLAIANIFSEHRSAVLDLFFGENVSLFAPDFFMSKRCDVSSNAERCDATENACSFWRYNLVSLRNTARIISFSHMQFFRTSPSAINEAIENLVVNATSNDFESAYRINMMLAEIMKRSSEPVQWLWDRKDLLEFPSELESFFVDTLQEDVFTPPFFISVKNDSGIRSVVLSTGRDGATNSYSWNSNMYVKNHVIEALAIGPVPSRIQDRILSQCIEKEEVVATTFLDQFLYATLIFGTVAAILMLLVNIGIGLVFLFYAFTASASDRTRGASVFRSAFSKSQQAASKIATGIYWPREIDEFGFHSSANCARIALATILLIIVGLFLFCIIELEIEKTFADNIDLSFHRSATVLRAASSTSGEGPWSKDTVTSGAHSSILSALAFYSGGTSIAMDIAASEASDDDSFIGAVDASNLNDRPVSPLLHDVSTIKGVIEALFGNMQTFGQPLTYSQVPRVMSNQRRSVIGLLGESLGIDASHRRWRDEISFFSSTMGITSTLTSETQTALLTPSSLELGRKMRQSSMLFTDSLISDRVIRMYVVEMALVSIILLILLFTFYFVVIPLLRDLEVEETGCRTLLRMIPTETRNAVPAIKYFLETGSFLNKVSFFAHQKGLENDLNEQSVSDRAYPEVEDQLGENSCIPVVVIDSSGVILQFSSAAERTFLRSKGEVLGENVRILMPDDVGVNHDSFIRNYLRTGIRQIIGKSGGRVVTAMRSDGSTFTAQLSVYELKSRAPTDTGTHTSKRTYFIGVVRDISSFIQREKTISSLLEMVQRSISPTVVIDPTGTIQMANIAAHDLFFSGGSCDSILPGLSVNLLMADHVAKKHDKYLQQYMNLYFRRGADDELNAKRDNDFGEVNEDIFSSVINKTRVVQGRRYSSAALTIAGADRASASGADLFPAKLTVRQLVFNEGAQSRTAASLNGASSNTSILFVGFLEDVSLKMSLELSAIASTSLLHGSPLPFVSADNNGLITSASRSASTFFGVTRLLGKNVSVLMSDDMASKHDSFISSYVSKGTGTIIGKGSRDEGNFNSKVVWAKCRRNISGVSGNDENMEHGDHLEFIPVRIHLFDLRLANGRGGDDPGLHEAKSTFELVSFGVTGAGAQSSSTSRMRKKIMGGGSESGTSAVSGLSEESEKLRDFFNEDDASNLDNLFRAFNGKSTTAYSTDFSAGVSRVGRFVAFFEDLGKQSVSSTCGLENANNTLLTSAELLVAQRTLSALSGVITTDEYGCITSISKMAEEIFGLSNASSNVSITQAYISRNKSCSGPGIIGRNVKVLIADRNLAKMHDSFFARHNKQLIQVHGGIESQTGMSNPSAATHKLMETKLDDDKQHFVSPYLSALPRIVTAKRFSSMDFENCRTEEISIEIQLKCIVMLVNATGTTNQQEGGEVRRSADGSDEETDDEDRTVGNIATHFQTTYIAYIRDVSWMERTLASANTINDALLLFNPVFANNANNNFLLWTDKNAVILGCSRDALSRLGYEKATELVGKHVRRVALNFQRNMMSSAVNTERSAEDLPSSQTNTHRVQIITNEGILFEASLIIFEVSNIALDQMNIETTKRVLSDRSSTASTRSSVSSRFMHDDITQESDVKSSSQKDADDDSVSGSGTAQSQKSSVTSLGGLNADTRNESEAANSNDAIYLFSFCDLSIRSSLENATSTNNSLLGASLSPLLAVDAYGVVTGESTSATTLLEYDTLIGTSINTLMPATIASVHDTYLTTFRKIRLKRVVDDPLGRELTVLTRSGRSILVRLTVFEVPVDVATDVNYSFIAFFQDLSSAHILQQANAVHKLVMRLSPVPIVAVSREGRILKANAATAKQFGYSQDQLEGRDAIDAVLAGPKNINILMPQEIASLHDSFLSRYDAESKFMKERQSAVVNSTRIVNGRRRDGTVFPLELSVRRVDISSPSATGHQPEAFPTKDSTSRRITFEDDFTRAVPSLPKSAVDTDDFILVGYMRNLERERHLQAVTSVCDAVFDNSPSPFVLTRFSDSTFSIVRANRAFESLYSTHGMHQGFSGSLQGCSILDFVETPTDFRARISEMIENPQENTHVTFPVRLHVRSDGAKPGTRVQTMCEVRLPSSAHITDSGVIEQALVSCGFRCDEEVPVCEMRSAGATDDIRVLWKFDETSLEFVSHKFRNMLSNCVLHGIGVHVPFFILDVTSSQISNLSILAQKLLLGSVVPKTIDANNVVVSLPDVLNLPERVVGHIKLNLSDSRVADAHISTQRGTLRGRRVILVAIQRLVLNREQHTFFPVPDQSEGKRVEDALFISAVAQFLESSPVSVVITDRGGIIQYVNHSTTELFSYPRERSLVGEDIKLFMPPATSCRHDAYMNGYLQSGTRRIMNTKRSVTCQRVGSGDVFPVELRVQDISRKHVFFATIRDLSPDLARRQDAGIVASVLSLSVDIAAFIIRGVHGAVISASPACEDLFGFSAKELLDAPEGIATLMPTSVGARHPSFIRRFISEGTSNVVSSGERRIHRIVNGVSKSGEVIRCVLRVREVPRSQHEECLFVGTLCPVSKRHAVRTIPRPPLEVMRRLNTVESTAKLNLPTLRSSCLRDAMRRLKPEKKVGPAKEGQLVLPQLLLDIGECDPLSSRASPTLVIECMFGASGDIINYIVLMCSTAAREAIGSPSTRIIGKYVTDLFSSTMSRHSTHQSVVEALTATLHGQSSQTIARLLLRSTGAEMKCRLSRKPGENSLFILFLCI